METRVSLLEDKVDRLEKKVDSQDGTNVQLAKLNTIIDIMSEELKETKLQTKKQAEATQKQSETMLLINNNISNLNKSLQTLDKRVEVLEENKKTNLNRWIDGGFKIVVAILTAYFLIQLGLK